jgi:hypothetical protein
MIQFLRIVVTSKHTLNILVCQGNKDKGNKDKKNVKTLSTIIDRRHYCIFIDLNYLLKMK